MSTTGESKAESLFTTALSTKSKSTQRQYRRELARFMTRWGVPDMETLYQMRLEHMRSGDPRDQRIIEGWAITLMAEMVKSGLAPGSARILGKAVSYFFDSQNLEFSIKNRDQPKGKGPGRLIILKDQIRVLYDFTGNKYKHKNRALIMLIKDSGLAIADVAKLDVEDFTHAKQYFNEAGEEFREFDYSTRQKTGVAAYVCIGPEAVRAVNGYLENRVKRKHPMGSGQPLFINAHKGRMSSSSLSMLFNRMATHLENGDRVGAHSLRKYHQTQLEAAGMPKNWLAKLQGRDIGDSTDAYSHPEDVPGMLMEAYMKRYDQLRIFNTVDLKEVRVLRDKVDQRDVELQRLRQELEESKRALGDRDRRMDAMEQTQDLIMRALKSPEAGPIFRKALQDLEEKAEKASRGPAS